MGGCRGEGAAPPPAMRTKKEVHRHKSRWISIKIKWNQINNDDACEKKRIVGSKGSRLKNKSGWGGSREGSFPFIFQEKVTSFFLSFFLPSFLPSFSSFSFQICFFDPYLFFLILICFFWSLFVFFDPSPIPSFLPSSHLPSTRKREKNPKQKREKNPKKNSPPFITGGAPAKHPMFHA